MRGIFCACRRQLLVNEIAPRPHNSGHYTIDACITSQFEQQVRVLCGMPLGSTAIHGAAVMVNLLGDLWQRGEPEWEQLLRYPNVELHLYGKAEAGRDERWGTIRCWTKRLKPRCSWRWKSSNRWNERVPIWAWVSDKNNTLGQVV